MQTRNDQAAKDADLTPTPTQAENDAAMVAATGGDMAPDVPPDGARKAEAEPKPPAHHEPERRVPAR